MISVEEAVRVVRRHFLFPDQVVASAERNADGETVTVLDRHGSGWRVWSTRESGRTSYNVARNLCALPPSPPAVFDREDELGGSPGSRPSEEEAKTILRSHVLPPGETIEACGPHPDGLLVRTTRGSWVVHSLEEAKGFTRSPGYTLYRITDAGERETELLALSGVAVLPSGRTVAIHRAEDFRVFHAEVGERLQPEELAVLLTMFQSEVVEDRERVVLQPEDLALHLDPTSLREHGVLAPRAPRAANGMDLVFETSFTSSESDDLMININRWFVAAHANGSIDWRVEPLARRLPSCMFQ